MDSQQCFFYLMLVFSTVSPRKAQFSFSGSLTESANAGKTLMEGPPTSFGGRKRYHMKKASILGLDSPRPAPAFFKMKKANIHNPIQNSPGNDRFLLGLGRRRTSEFSTYVSPQQQQQQQQQQQRQSGTAYSIQFASGGTSMDKFVSSRSKVEKAILAYKSRISNK